MRLKLAMADGGHSEAATAAAWFTPIVAAFSTLIGGFGLWLANRLLGKAAIQAQLNIQFKDFTDQLQEERAILMQTLAAERLAWASERAQLRGEVINLTQAVESLKSILRRNGLDIPETHRPAPDYEIIPGGSTHD